MRIRRIHRIAAPDGATGRTETMSDVAPPSSADAGPPALDDPRLYANRELSLLDFQWRVLDEARHAANPLLERVKFLSIVGSNLDEFFMIRVAGLMQQVEAGVLEAGADGRTPAAALGEVRRECARLMHDARETFLRELVPALAGAGIDLVDWDALDADERRAAKAYFDEKVFPVLARSRIDQVSLESLHSHVPIELSTLREIHWWLAETFCARPAINEMRRWRAAADFEDPDVFVRCAGFVPIAPTQIVQGILRRLVQRVVDALGEQSIQPGALVHFVEVVSGLPS